MDTQTPSEMHHTVNDLSDEALDMELSFADGFDLDDEAGKTWHEALRAEKDRRTQ